MRQWAKDFDVAYAEADVFTQGGAGAEKLGQTLLNNLEGTSTPLYDPAHGVEASIDTIAKEIYRAEEVQYSKRADRKSTRLNSSHVAISYAVFCWKTKTISGLTR